VPCILCAHILSCGQKKEQYQKHNIQNIFDKKMLKIKYLPLEKMTYIFLTELEYEVAKDEKKLSLFFNVNNCTV
jgi:hypothetical protein